VRGRGKLVLGGKAVALRQRPPVGIEMTDGRSPAGRKWEEMDKGRKEINTLQGREEREGKGQTDFLLETRSIRRSKSSHFFPHFMDIAVKASAHSPS